MRKQLLLAALAAVGVGSSAMAANVIDVTTNPYGAGGQGGGIRVGTLSFASYGPTGRFNVSGSNVASMAAFFAHTFCIDVTKPFYSSAPDNRFEIKSLAAFSSNATKQAQVAALLLNTQGLISGALTTAERDLAGVATGLAIWEIVYESGTTGYSVSSEWANNGDGNFFVYGDFAPYHNATNQYLAKVESGEWTGATSRLRTLVSVTGAAQNQIFVVAVPEPATWGLMILGFGAIGTTMRGRATKRGGASAHA